MSEEQIRKLYIVHHEYECNGRDCLKFIGAFSTMGKAHDAISELRSQPGFREWPDCFDVGEVEIDEFFWTEGFGAGEKLLKLLEE